MTVKKFIEGLQGQYPESLHPTQSALQDIIRTLRTLKYNEKQMMQLYDRCIQNCNYFPRVSDIITQASGLALPLSQKLPEPAWETFKDNQHRCWAKKVGKIYPETEQEMSERYYRDAISATDGGMDYYMQGFRQARGIPDPVIDTVKSTRESSDKSLADFFSVAKSPDVVVEYQGEIISWDDL